MSVIRYLLDEHVDHAIRDQLRQLNPQMDILAIGDPGAPGRGMSDPELLLWIEQSGRVLITGNRRTMPDHFRDHLASGHHVPGIFVLTRRLSLGAAIEQLHLI
jgi:hypothetical protein